MQQPKSKSQEKPRQIRLEREHDAEIVAEDAGSWAVSYSDLLMVLMSFFVIFFSFSPKKTESIISNIVLTMDKDGAGTKKLPSQIDNSQGAPVDRAEEQKQVAAFHSAMSEKLRAASLDAIISADAESVTVDLPDSIYKPRGFAATAAVKETLAKVFAMITPFASQVDVYFVGHTDAAPISQTNEYLSDNFVLSTLRATHALQYALKSGLPQNHLFAQGGAENVRNSRTLSVIVKVRPLTPAH